jgi:serine/threonine protein phosphatase PrpC
VAGRASIVGAAETNVGKVRNHNEDSHFIDPELGIFLVCDGMGGHAAGEVASAMAVATIREAWSSDATQTIAERWLSTGTPDARKQLITAIQSGVTGAHDAIIAEAQRDRTKGGMGTTLVGAMLVGGDIVFAQCGDSRAYLVRDGIAMQLTEDHTLLARLLAAGVDVDVSGDGSRFKSMLTNALGIGQECKVATFVVPVADGDRFLLCSDGITEYLQEAEIGEVLCKMPSPARAAQKLVEIALERGGGDNATALVVRVLEAGETSRPAELIQKEEKAIFACPLWANVSPQQRLRALRIALPRDHVAGEKIPAHTLGDRVAWILVDGEVDQDGQVRGPGALLYPEALLTDRPLPEKDALAVTRGEVRALALRSDDFREVCEDDPELAEVLLEALASEIASRRPQRRTGRIVVQFDADARGSTDPQGHALVPDDAPPLAPPPPAPLPVPPPIPPPPPAVDPEPAEINMEADEPPQEEIDAGRAPTLPPPVAARARTKPPNALIANKAETEAALDDTFAKLTGEAAPVHVEPEASPALAAQGEEEKETVIEVEANEPPEPVAQRAVTSPPSRAVGDHSDAEISIEMLTDAVENVVELEADAPEPLPAEPAADDHVEMIVAKDEDSARIVEVIKDTSSQTITMTVEEPAEAEIIVVETPPK